MRARKLMRCGREAFNPPRELAASSGKLIMMSAAENASPANHGLSSSFSN
jgi:hypothetical protein